MPSKGSNFAGNSRFQSSRDIMLPFHGSFFNFSEKDEPVKVKDNSLLP